MSDNFVGWWRSGIFQRCESLHQHQLIQLQHSNHQICLLRCLSFFQNDTTRKVATKKLVEAMCQEPSPLHARFTANLSQYITQWTIDFATNPKMLAKAICKTLVDDKEEARIFIYTSFPALFQNFQTLEFNILAVEFLKEIILNGSSDLSVQFFAAYILGSQKFISTLWNVYDNIIVKKGTNDIVHVKDGSNIITNTMNDKNPAVNTSKCFLALNEALKKSASALTKQHFEIIRFYKEHNPDDLAKGLLIYVLRTSFEESHLFYKNTMQVQPMIDILDYGANHLDSPHFEMLYDSLTEKCESFWIPSCKEMVLKKIPFVFCCHEFLIFQKIAKYNPELTSLKLIKGLEIPETFNLDLGSVFFEIGVPILKLDHLFPTNDERESFFNSTLVFNEPAMNTNINNNISDSSEEKTLSRRWQRIIRFSNSNGCFPLSIFEENSYCRKMLGKYCCSELFDLSKESQLYQYALNDIHQNIRDAKNGFEIFMRKSYLNHYVREMAHIARSLYTVSVSKFTQNLMKINGIGIPSFQSIPSNSQEKPNLPKPTKFDGSQSIKRFLNHFVKRDNSTDPLNDSLDMQADQKTMVSSNSTPQISHSKDVNNLQDEKEAEIKIVQNNTDKQNYDHILYNNLYFSSAIYPIPMHNITYKNPVQFNFSKVIRNMRRQSADVGQHINITNSKRLLKMVQKICNKSYFRLWIYTKIIDESDSHDKTLSSLKDQFSAIFRILRLNNSNYNPVDDDVEKYVSDIISSINYFLPMKLGGSIIFLINISFRIILICEKVLYNKSRKKSHIKLTRNSSDCSVGSIASIGSVGSINSVESYDIENKSEEINTANNNHSNSNDIHDIQNLIFNQKSKNNKRSNRKTTLFHMLFFEILIKSNRNEELFESFIWLEKLLFHFPDIKTNISPKITRSIREIEHFFWRLLSVADKEMYSKCKSCSQVLF